MGFILDRFEDNICTEPESMLNHHAAIFAVMGTGVFIADLRLSQYWIVQGVFPAHPAQTEHPTGGTQGNRCILGSEVLDLPPHIQSQYYLCRRKWWPRDLVFYRNVFSPRIIWRQVSATYKGIVQCQLFLFFSFAISRHHFLNPILPTQLLLRNPPSQPPYRNM